MTDTPKKRTARHLPSQTLLPGRQIKLLDNVVFQRDSRKNAISEEFAGSDQLLPEVLSCRACQAVRGKHGHAKHGALPQHRGDNVRSFRNAAQGTSYAFTYGQYKLNYEVYGSGDKVLVWLHGILLDANLSRALARRLAARGYRVVLLDLLGHGRSDKPRQPGSHRMDLYTEQVLCLLDELGVDQVVLGGVSLGTNVSLLATVRVPEKVRGLILEMPVLETAAPAAALTFVPLLLQLRIAKIPLRLVSQAVSWLPASGIGPLDSVLGAVASGPDEMAAILHGVLMGPIAPTVEQRQAIVAPTLVLGHGIDLIHSFADARQLARQLPNARLIRTRTFAELWITPARLTGKIAEFLDRVWADGQPQGPWQPRKAA